MHSRNIALLYLTSGFILLQAQPFTPPGAYSITQVNSLFGAPRTLKIYKSGSMASIVHVDGGHTITLDNLATGQSLDWDSTNPGNGCSAGTFSGSWGDPFADMAEVTGDPSKMKQSGTETIAGIPAKIMDIATKDGPARAWLDPKTGLVLKLQFGGRTLVEVTSVSYTAPPASVFTPPANCKFGPPPPPPLSPDFAKADMGPASENSCTVAFRVVKEGSMEPVTSGFQVAVDPAYDIDHPSHYTIGVNNQGHSTFSGGGLKEMTAQLRNGVLRVDNVGKTFDVEFILANGGAASAVVYRQCVAPQTVLLLVLKNPQKPSDGADWLWVKSGKYAAVP